VRRSGFILLFGTRPIISADASTPPANVVCPRCGQRADLVSKIYRPWFTIFFIPVFPVGAAKRFSQCSSCGAQFMAEPREIERHAAASDQQQMQRAITLYNSMRASPANSVTLNELMSQYATIDEFDQAISAARDFPQALAASEQCMVTLGRVYLAKNDHPQALRWFNEAIARNPALAEAHYFKAVAYLTSNPPDKDAAAAAARLAKSHGYSDVDKLPI
jgi:tetratricopeptide (TPR) repeat protein